MAKSKDKIANDLYDDDYDYLSSGEKAAVTKAFNAQGNTRPQRKVGGVKATIGRMGKNGTTTVILSQGATVQDLLDQSKYTIDVVKEKILDNDTTEVVELDDLVKNNGTYAIAVEIKSAE